MPSASRSARSGTLAAAARRPFGRRSVLAAVALCAVAALLGVLIVLTVVRTAEAKPTLAIKYPANGATISGRSRFAIKTNSHRITTIRFYVDGKRVFLDKHRPWRYGKHGRLSTAKMKNGPHLLTVKARTKGGQILRDTHLVTVRNGKRVKQPGGGPSSPGAAWHSGFEGGNFREWSWWGQGDDTWGDISVVDPSDEGVPRKEGDRVGRFEVTDNDKPHAKLYKGFSLKQVSGSYRAWFYIPKDFAVPLGTASNVFQFKDHHGGGSDPTWWLQLSTASWAKRLGGNWHGPQPSRDDAPVIWMHWIDNDFSRTVQFKAAPLGRWFEMRADVVDGQSIDFSVDGDHLDTARNSVYPVGPLHDDSDEWTFGVGNYSTGDTNPRGPLYIDDVSVTR